MAKTKRKPPRVGNNRWASQAAANAMVRYLPEREGLQEALQQAQQTYGSTVKASRSNAVLTKGAVNAAIAATRGIQQQTNERANRGQQALSGILAGIPGIRPEQLAGLAAERQVQESNRGNEGAQAETSLQAQKVAARSGAQFAEQNARQVLQEQIMQLVSKGGRIDAKEGAAASAEANNLANQALDRQQREAANREDNAVSTANNERTTAASEANSRRSAAGRGSSGLPKGVKLRSAGEHETARGTIQQAREWAFNTLRYTRHFNYNQAYKQVAKGSPALKDASGHVLRPAIKGLGEGPIARAATDLAYFGGIGSGTAKMLHEKGFTLKGLQYPVYHPHH